MLIRLRVPKDGEKNGKKTGDQKQRGLRGWFLRYFGSSRESPLPAPAAPLPNIDKRWITRGDAHYFTVGRNCIRRDGVWLTEYRFDIVASGQLEQIRIILPEPLIAPWEREHNQRLPEATRVRLVRETLETLLDLEQRPAAVTVSSDAIGGALP